MRKREIRAYLDVYETVPATDANERKGLKDMYRQGNIFTYRGAWFTKEGVRIKGEKLIQNIRGYLSGETGSISKPE